jgi:hypothetical protein
MKDLPEKAKTLFTDGMRFAMADPGKPWEAGDAVDWRLPTERLILAGVSKKFAFVHYEHGGFADGYAIEVYQVSPSGWQPVWSQHVAGEAHDLKQLRKFVAATPIAATPKDLCCCSADASASKGRDRGSRMD